jgi:alkylhydroperoxidase family enzyme
MSYMNPLPAEASPELKEEWDIFTNILGFVPNSLLTMQRRPKMVQGFGELTKAVMDPNGVVDLGLMRLIAHFSSRAAGCQYCEAHSLVAAKIQNVPQEKLDAIWEYQSSPLYSEAERVALDFALAAGSVPNAVDADLFSRMNQHWTEEQIVQILGAICLYGFLNRWNDSMATDLEDSPREMGEKVLTKGGWTGGKHV